MSHCRRIHISGTLGALPIDKLTPERVRSWYAALSTKHTRRNSHAYGLLHAVLATAVKDGLLHANPCQIELVMNPQPKREPVILTVPEVAALADAVPERLKAAVHQVDRMKVLQRSGAAFYPSSPETILIDAKVCKHCGYHFPLGNMRCHHCQHVQAVPLGLQKFVCEQCGAKLMRKTPPVKGS
jgi:hypothetical protein